MLVHMPKLKPALSTNQRVVPVMFRVSVKEKKQIDRDARMSGAVSLSDYIRACVVRPIRPVASDLR